MEVRTLKSLEWDSVLVLLSLCAGTEEGKSLIRTLTPESTIEMVRARHVRVRECVEGEALSGRLSLEGYRRVETRVPEGMSFELDVLRQMRSSLDRWSAAVEWVEDENAPKPSITSAMPDISNPAEVLAKLNRILDDRGEIADTASDRLRGIRREREKARGNVLTTMESLSKSFNDNVLRDKNYTVRGGRLVLPVQSSFKSEVRGILHDTSSSGGTFFIEPMEVVELNNRLTALEAEERDEIKRILIDVSALISAVSEDLEASFEFVENLDRDIACARFGRRCEGTLPDIDEEGNFILVGARHPLLDKLLYPLRKEAWQESPKDQVVPLDLSMSLKETRTLIVSGPNAGGKSVALKTAGLICAMSQAGIPCPVEEGTKLPVFPCIYAIIGDSQSILDDVSTFSARMVELKSSLEKLEEPFLFILDELGSGTDPAEGAALARAILERLHTSRGITLCSTHYESLKALALVTPDMGNASMAFEEEKMAPTFRLQPGTIGSSRAIEIAERSGMPKDLLDSARAYLPRGEKHLKEVLEALEARVAEYGNLKSDLEKSRAELEDGRNRLRAQESEKIEEKKKFMEALPEHLQKIRDKFLSELKDEAEKRAVRKAASKVASRIVRETTEEIALPKPSVRKNKMPVPGEWVSVLGMGVKGEVKSVDEGTGTVTLDCGGKTLSIGVGDTLPTDPPDGSLSMGRGVESGPIDAGWEINLIGMRVAEAEAELEPFVDRALMAGLSKLRIIHGVGTGRLRKFVREWAAESPSVLSIEDAAQSEGGAGATIFVIGVDSSTGN